MRAILHIGTEKTGTSSLQYCLASNRPLLEAHGFRYARAAGDLAQSGLVIHAAPEMVTDLCAQAGLVSPDALARHDRRLQKRLATETRAFPDACFLFSSEHCHSRLVEPYQVARLHDLLSGFFDQIDLIVYVRRQDNLAASFYSNYIRGGGCSEVVIPPALNRDYFDYERLLDRWREVFAGTLTVVSYDRLPTDVDVVDDFVARFGLPTLDRSAGAMHKTLSAVAQDVIRRLNVHLCDDLGPLRSVLVDAVILTDSAEGPRPGRLPTREAATAFVENFREANTRVATRFYNGEPLFDDDFSKYPIEPLAIDTDAADALFAGTLTRLVVLNHGLQGERTARTDVERLLERERTARTDAERLLEHERTARTDAERLLERERTARTDAERLLEHARTARTDAERLLEHARANRDGLEAELSYYAGLVHLDAGRIDMARDVLRKGVARAPNRDPIWQLLARAHHAAGATADALHAIDQALAIAPGEETYLSIRKAIAASAQSTASASSGGGARRKKWWRRAVR